MSLSLLKAIPPESQKLEVKWPNLEPLPTQLPPVQAFDPELLPSAFRSWIMDVAERMQCPPDYPAAALMVCLSSVIGNQVAIRPKRHDDWTVVPNLWGAIVGPPSAMKTPALAEAIRIVGHLEKSALERHRKAVARYQAQKVVAEESAKKIRKDIATAIKKGQRDVADELALTLVSGEVEEPPEPRYMTSDVTVEKLGEVLEANPRGILIFRDELVGFLQSLDREGREGSRAFYLEAWIGNGSFTYDRIGRGTVRIERACVSILGGIQPGPLSAYLSAAYAGKQGDDGLVQRFQVLVYPDLPKNWCNVDRVPDREAREAAFEVFRRLDHLDPEKIGACGDDSEIPWLHFDEEAQDIFNEWRAALENRLRNEDMPPVLEAHLAKYRSLVPSLALIFHLVDVGQGPVDEEAVLRACAWAEYLESHARRIYHQALAPDLAAAVELAKRLPKLPNPFRPRDVYRKGWRLLNRQGTTQALSVLEELGWIRSKATDTEGRPTVDYHINPQVLQRGGKR